MSRRRTSLAWHNLRHDRARSVVAVAGVGFALLTIFMQSGFLQSVLRTATIVTDKFDYDLLILSRDYFYFAESGNFPRARLFQAEEAEGVRDVVPIYLNTSTWRNPELGNQAERRPLLILGFDLETQPFRSHETFRASDVTDRLNQLKPADTVLVDRRSRGEYGPLRVGVRPEIGLRRYRIVGLFAMGTGFAADGAVIVGESAYQRLFGLGATGRVSLGLVRLKPGADANEVARRLTDILPPEDVQVLTRSEYRFREMAYWVLAKSIGAIFVIGVTVAFLVGAVVAHQVLSGDIADHAAEYATLRAIGYTGGQLAVIVLEEAWIIAGAAYLPALAVSWGLYGVVRQRAAIPIDMHPSIIVFVLALAAVMCSVSAVASIRRVVTADPADTFG